GVLAVGVTFVIITGGIDLSIGTGMTFASVMTGVFVTNLGFPVWIGILVGLLTGALIGFINGLCIAKLKIPAFIATLGMMMITKGLSLIMSDAKPIYFIDIPHFSEISTGKWFGIPMAVFIFFAAALIANIILNKTIIGRYDFAIGSNMQATRLSGINTDRWLIIIHTMAGLFVGLAGVLMAARLNSAQPALGQGYELDAIAAVVIGGTSLNGGKGTITGTVIGAFIMSTLLNGLRIMSVPQEWQTVLTGIIVIAAVFGDIYRRNKQAKA
ncbi:MAG: ABC transporter permease, partial [Vallitaleaceae bacterium]|nr:ABC transporter permease [Vallitaleaceae bacterium]